MSWQIVSKGPAPASDPLARMLLEKAWAAAPPGFVDENVIEMLPRKGVTSHCRLCGVVGKLTKEHIPPKASGNKQTARSYSFDNWLNRTDISELPGGKAEQGGVFGYTLCGPCNSYTGTHYGAEYQRWARAAWETLDGLPHPGVLDELTEPLGWRFEAGSRQDGGLSPGALTRQVLSCFCTLSGSWDLAKRHPEIRPIVLEQSQEAVPSAVELGFGLYLGPHSRMVGPTVLVEPDVGEWRWLMELAFPPFSFLCVIDSNVKESGIGLIMNDWTTLDPVERKLFEGEVRVGFGWTPTPGDYRTRAAILSQS